MLAGWRHKIVPALRSPASKTVVRRRRLTPRNRSESTCYHPDRRPICALTNTTGATSRSRWPRLSFLVTYSPTSCAVSTGSDRRQPRHERRHPVPSRRRRQDRCARIAGKMPFRATIAANWSSIIRIGAKMAVIRRRIARRAVSSHT